MSLIFSVLSFVVITLFLKNYCLSLVCCSSSARIRGEGAKYDAGSTDFGKIDFSSERTKCFGFTFGSNFSFLCNHATIESAYFIPLSGERRYIFSTSFGLCVVTNNCSTAWRGCSIFLSNVNRFQSVKGGRFSLLADFSVSFLFHFWNFPTW